MFNPDSEIVMAGLQVMLYGLAGVFTVLILFYVVTKGMVAFFTRLEKNRKAKADAR